MSDLSDKEKLKIVRHFLLSSPPAQFGNVEKSLRTLVGNDLIDRSLPVIAKRYNEEQLLMASVPDSEVKFLITKIGALSEKEYYEPSSNSVIVFDHINKSPEGKRDAAPGEGTPEDLKDYRELAARLLHEYVSNFYPAAGSVVYATSSGGNATVTAFISATKANIGSKWAGRLRSEYSATFQPGSATAQVTGGIKGKIHCYEDGNVQLNTDGDLDAAISAQNAEEFAKSFVAAIEKFEGALHKKLETSFVDLSENTFKALRRKLPINQMKFDFDNWSQYEIGSELSKQ